MRPVLLALLTLPLAAQTRIDLNGSIWDGNGGPLVAGPVYHIISTGGACGISVPAGQTLTIHPGAIIKIGGCFLTSGTVNAIGTPSQHIVFTSQHDDSAGGDTNMNGGATTPAAGDWGEIDAGGLATFEWCDWHYGGRQGGGAFNLRLQPHVFRDCRFEHMREAVLTGASEVRVERCHFHDLGGLPVTDLHFRNIHKFVDNTATLCAVGAYPRFVDGRNFLGNLVLDHRLSINGDGVFVFAARHLSPVVPAGTHLTLPAGTVCKFENGFIGSLGSLLTQSTAAQPVVFTSIDDDAYGGDTRNDGAATSPAPGDWTGLDLQGGDTSDLQYAVIRCAGVGSGGKAIAASGSSATIANSIIEHSAGDGIAIRNLGAPPMAITDTLIQDNAGLSIRGIHWAELANCTGNGTANNGAGDHFQVVPERPNSAITIAPGNFPGDVLEVAGGTIFQAGGSLSLPAGTILKFPSRQTSTFSVSASTASLYLRGTARRPIVLTSFKDDTWGGDTNGDGNASQPAANDIGRITFGSSTGNCVLDNVLVRYGTATTIENSSANVTLRNVRVDHAYGAGIRLHRAAGDVVNLVAFGCTGNGIELQNGTYDLLHATAANNGGIGIARTSLWSGQVLNSNSWGNTGGNISVPAAQLAFSNGVGPVLAGQNGNTDVDPQFANAAAGDLHLQATSPCLGTADFATSQRVMRDHDETSRVQDHALSGSLRADMGAYERAAYHMDVSGDSVLGTTMTFVLQGPGGIGAVFFSFEVGQGLLIPGLGDALVGFPNVTLPPGVVTMGQPVQFVQPPNPALDGVHFEVQGLGLQLTGGLHGGFTQVDRNELHFD